ncbi:DUF4376 domain-containing protein [Chromohalobacter israelensis]|uniref:DUF4376 domain-containing protein n=1 Tax=Chromohalobacter israelensis TaxID=141390 RepID=UPI000558609A|nr:DUF4376 domain-containing protein [Chromohalobacter israelensis]MDF9433019.1 DUF4376 domain-containing protein [Chromohalobacter israelensis]
MRIYDINPTDQTVIDPAGREAPRDPMRGEPRVPRGAMVVEPPETGDHEVARAVDSETWEVVADWRGHVYYTADGRRHEITELGVEPPADALDEAPPEPLEDVAARKRDEIEIARDEAIAAGFEHAFGDATDTVQMRQRDRENIMGLAVSAQRNPESTFEFRAESNAKYQLTADEMLELAEAAQAHVSEQYQHSWQRKGEIDAALEAEDRDALEALSW